MDGSGDAGLYRTAIGALCGVIAFLVALSGKLAKMLWDVSQARLQDRNETIAQLNAAHQVAVKKKEVSP